MCGRYVSPEQAAMERFWHIGRHNWVNRFASCFNVAPTSTVPILIRAQDGVLELVGARWGLIPHWWKQDMPPSLTFNSRSEEASRKPTWRHSLNKQRCLMPVRGWYEWQQAAAVQGAVGRKIKQPYFIHSSAFEVMAFAGLWATWKPSNAEPVVSCALLSKAAAPLIAQIHHRMPVVLKPQHHEEWLDPGTSPGRVQAIIDDCISDFEGYAVSTLVNNARNNTPQLIEKLATAG